MSVFLQILVSSFPLRDTSRCNLVKSGSDYLFLDDNGLDLLSEFFIIHESYSGKFRELNSSMRTGFWLRADALVFGGFVIADHVFNHYVVDSMLIGDYFITCLVVNATRKCMLVLSSDDGGFIGSKCDDIINSSPEMARLVMSVPEIDWG